MASRYSKFYALLKQVNANGAELTKEQVILDFTGGLSDSLSARSDQELRELEQNLHKLTNSKPAIPEGDETRDSMRKAIIAIFKSIGKTTENAKNWAEKYGALGNKRSFNDYTEQELKALITKAEKMKSDFKKSFNKQ